MPARTLIIWRFIAEKSSAMRDRGERARWARSGGKAHKSSKIYCAHCGSIAIIKAQGFIAKRLTYRGIAR